MRRVLSSTLALCLMATPGWAQLLNDDVRSSLVLGAGKYLTAGADAIRAGQYDDGIRLTLRGLDHDGASLRNRAAGLANLCAAHVSKREPDKAIAYCFSASSSLSSYNPSER